MLSWLAVGQVHEEFELQHINLHLDDF